MTRVLAVVCLGVALLPAGAGRGQPPAPPKSPADWKDVLAERVKAFGHRNWVVVADSAYPVQTRGGIETVVTGADHLTVLRAVLDELARSKHVRPVVYLDAELPLVPEADAPGIGAYRAGLGKVLGDRRPQSLPHEGVIARLDKAGETFRVLVLKTDLTLPYTSVFLELDCGYWSPDAERRLRESVKPGR
jgi:hypothetical protein